MDEDTFTSQDLVSGSISAEAASRSLLDLSEAALQPLDQHQPNPLKVNIWVDGVRQFNVEPENNTASESESVQGISRNVVFESGLTAGPSERPPSLQTGPNVKLVRGKGVLKPTFPCEHCGRVFNNRSELR